MATKIRQPAFPPSLTEGGWFLPTDYVLIKVSFRRQLQDRLGRLLPPEGGTVLDLNAGTAGPGPDLKARGHDYLALDSNPLIRAALEEQGLRARDWRPTRIPCPDASVDLVLAFAFLEHLPTWLAAFEQLLEVRRVLRPGGRFLVISANAPGMGSSYFDDYKHSWMTSRKRLGDMAEDAGFAVADARYTIGWITYVDGPATALASIVARTVIGLTNLSPVARTLEALRLDRLSYKVRKTLLELVAMELRKPDSAT